MTNAHGVSFNSPDDRGGDELDGEGVIIRKLLEAPTPMHIKVRRKAREIDDACRRQKKEQISQLPQVLSIWALAKYELGQFSEALHISSAAAIHHRQDSIRRYQEEKLFQAKARLALSQISKADEIIRELEEQKGGHFSLVSQVESAHSSTQEFLGNFYLIKARVLFNQGKLLDAQKAFLQIFNVSNHEALQIYARAQLKRLSARTMVEVDDDECFEIHDVEFSDPKLFALQESVAEAMSFARALLSIQLSEQGEELRASKLLSDQKSFEADADTHYLARGVLSLLKAKFKEAEGYIQLALDQQMRGSATYELFDAFWYEALTYLAQGEKDDARAAIARLCLDGERLKKSPLAAQCGALLGFLKAEREDFYAAEKLFAQAMRASDARSKQTQALLFFSALLLKEGSYKVQDKTLATLLEKLLSTRHIDRSVFLSSSIILSQNPKLLALVIRKIGLRALPADFLDLLCAEAVLNEYSHIERVISAPEANQLRTRLALCSVPKQGSVQREPNEVFEIQLFGSLEIKANGHNLDASKWRRSKARDLFLFVLCHADKDVSRDYVIDRLWPDMAWKAACNNYYVTWSKLKKMVQGGEVRFTEKMPIKCTGTRFTVDTQSCRVDVIEMLKLSREGQRLAGLGRFRDALDAFRAAAHLYRGDLLPGDLNDEWISGRREYFKKCFADILQSGMRCALELEDHHAGLYFCELSQEFEFENERFYELNLQILSGLGERELASKMYRNYYRYVSEVLGLNPSSTMSQIYSDLLAEPELESEYESP